MLQVVAENYRNIDGVYRRAFWIIFGVLCFAFGFHAIQFMLGNHDWGILTFYQEWQGLHSGRGRYALYLFKKIFFNGIYLPLICDVVSLFFLALNAVLLCAYWRLEKRVSYFGLCGLVLTAQPFTLDLMYFVHMLPETFIGVTFVLITLMLSEKIAFRSGSLMKKGSLAFLSIVLINLSLAIYPVLLNTIAVAFIGRLLVLSFEWDGSWKQFRFHFVRHAVSVINIVLGILSYKIMLSLVFLPEKGYNTQTLPLDQLPERLLVLCKQSFHQLYEYNFPFISQAVLWVFLCFTILVALYICLTGDFKQKIVRLILLGGALFATQTTMIISDTHLLAPRVELFGLVVFETLMMVLVFTRLGNLANLNVLVATGVVWVSVINDLDCLRVWKLGFDAERMLWNRVLARMEIQKDFSSNRKYKIVQIGRPISLRPRFYQKPCLPEQGCDKKPMLTFSYDADWDIFHAYEFFYQADFRGEKICFPTYNNYRTKTQLKRLWEAGILDKARAWPHENGLIVWKDVILFVTDAKALENCKKQLAKEFPRQSQKTP